MKKSIAIFLIVILVINLILLGLNAISIMWFWGIIIFAAIVAFWVFPRIK